MSYILSLQSHVAYGYVGNCVASFVLQRMGYEVIANIIKQPFFNSTSNLTIGEEFKSGFEFSFRCLASTRTFR